MKKVLVVLGIIALMAFLVPSAKAITQTVNFDVDVDVTSEESLSCVAGGSLVHMLPDIGGITGGTATGSTLCTVISSDAAGYEVFIRGDSYTTASGNAGRLLRAGTGADKYNRFDAFGSTSVPAAWSVTDSAQFGYNVSGDHPVAGFGGAWTNYAALYASDTAQGGTHGLKVAEVATETGPGGDDVYFNFKAQFEPDTTDVTGPDHLQEGVTPSTSYVTAVEVWLTSK